MRKSMKRLMLCGSFAGMLKYVSAAVLIILLSLSCTKTPVMPDPEDPDSDPKDETPYTPPAVTGHVVGYLVYMGFEHEFFDTLLTAFDEFKSAGVTDLILDLRYNGGGHVVSSQGLASIIAGSWCKDKVFAYDRYNDDRMKAIGCDPADYRTYDYHKFFNDLAERYNFSFSKFYVIVSSRTASASELLINALRGINYEVIVVGNENSIGKDVGMEVPYEKTIGDYCYQPVVITFQSYNAKGESDYNNGFAPNMKLSDDYRKYVPEDWGVPADHNLRLRDEYNSLKKFSYDYLTEILLDINGGNDVSYDNIEVVNVTSAQAGTRAIARQELKRSQLPGREKVTLNKTERPFRENMVIFREDMTLPSTRALSIPEIASDPVKDWIDPWMDNYYLWNDAYRTCTKNYSLPADQFLENMLNQMKNKGANLQDGFMSGNTWHFFSYVDIWPAAGTVSAATTRGRESSDRWNQTFTHPQTLGFGLELSPAYLSDQPDKQNRLGFIVDAVYPGSPAEKAGIVRGDIILKIDGTALTDSNYTTYIPLLYETFSSAVTYKFTLIDFNSALGDMKDGATISVTAADYERDPVIFKSIYRFKN